MATVPGHAIAEIQGRNERLEDSPIMQKLGLNYFDAFEELPHVVGQSISWTWKPAEGPTMLNMRPNPRDPKPTVTLVAPAEVDKGRKVECWVSGCRVYETLKKCECLASLYGFPSPAKQSAFVRWPLHRLVLLRRASKVCLAAP